MSNDLIGYVKSNPAVTITVVCAIAVCLIAAMYFGLDLSWIPDLLRGLIE